MMHRQACVLLNAFILGGLLAACNGAPATAVHYDPAALQLSGERALALEAEFVGQFPNRHSGEPNNRLAAEWLRDQLAGEGWDCRLDEWGIVNYSRTVPLRNVVCVLQGESEREILVVAHHDQAPTTVQGADNDGSGIAILLHLAEIFAAGPAPRYTLAFVATDAEEYGMIGARRYIETHPEASQIIAGISLDNLGKEWSNGMNMEPIGQFRGYGPLWLLLAAREAARAAGDLWIPRIKPPIEQVLDQAVPISFMDQGPIVAAGVPALGFATSFPAESLDLHWQTFHTPDDTLEHQSPVVLEQSGRIAEALIRELLAREDFPQESGPYVYSDLSGQVLHGVPLWAIFLGFVGLFFAGSFLSGRGGTIARTRAWRAILPHFLGLWVPLLASIALLYLFVQVGLMDEYHRYPATQKDPAFYQPRWPAVGLFLAGLVLFLGIGRRLAGKYGKGAVASPGQIKSLALFIVGLSGVYILAVNPFSLLFLVPLLVWYLIGGRRGAGRLLDLLLFALGGLVVYALFYFFGFAILRIDFLILWYLMMMFSIGMVSFPTAAAITAIIGAGLAMIVNPPRAAEAPRRRS